MKPRQYQIKAKTDTRESLKKGNKNVALCLSVGSGKSLIARMILETAKGKIGFFTFRTILIDQMKPHIDKMDLDITYGTLQGKCKEKTELYDLVIVDENWGHSSKLKANINTRFMITLTGTPIDENGYSLDYDDIIDGVQLPDLVEQGFAKRITVLSTSKIDTSKLKKQGSDFNKKQSFELMDKSTIKKDIIETYNKHCLDRKVLLFAIDTNHAESLKEEFLSNNIKAETIHSKKKSDGILKDFKDGIIDVLINVEMITVGVDIPAINCIIFARPMRSIPLFIQCIGRGTRVNPDNIDDDCLIIDMAEVLKRTGHHPMQRLDFTKKKQDKKVKSCKCGNPLRIIAKEVKEISEYEYLLTTKYRCDVCNIYEQTEEIKAVNYSFCEKCSNVLEVGNIKYKQSDNKIEFFTTCGKCGHEKTEREVLLNEKELSEIKYQEVMKTSSWEKVEIMLKAECRKWKYHHKYSTRLIDIMKSKNKTPEEVELYIENIIENNQKISSLQFKG